MSVMAGSGPGRVGHADMRWVGVNAAASGHGIEDINPPTGLRTQFRVVGCGFDDVVSELPLPDAAFALLEMTAGYVTSTMLGTLRSNSETRSEFLRLCGNA